MSLIPVMSPVSFTRGKWKWTHSNGPGHDIEAPSLAQQISHDTGGTSFTSRKGGLYIAFCNISVKSSFLQVL